MAAETPSFISISNYPQPDSRLLIAPSLPLSAQGVTENFEATHDNVRKEHLSKVLLWNTREGATITHRDLRARVTSNVTLLCACWVLLIDYCYSWLLMVTLGNIKLHLVTL